MTLLIGMAVATLAIFIAFTTRHSWLRYGVLAVGAFLFFAYLDGDDTANAGPACTRYQEAENRAYAEHGANLPYHETHLLTALEAACGEEVGAKDAREYYLDQVAEKTY